MDTSRHDSKHIVQTNMSPSILEVCDISTTVAVKVPDHFACHQFCTPTNILNLALGGWKNGEGARKEKQKRLI